MSEPASESGFARRHRGFGLWLLAASMAFGLGLEVLHGLKAGWYLDPAAAVRREMWRLAHTHGTLLALVNLVFATMAGAVARAAGRRLPLVSHLLRWGVLLPLGFLLGGLFPSEHDPWVPVLLAPVGALAGIAAVLLVAAGNRRQAS